MNTILENILAHKRQEVEKRMAALPQRELYARVAEAPPVRSMRAALESAPCGIIAEFKRRSPSLGWIHRNADPGRIVPEYTAAGAAAVSILTDESFFGGSLDDLRAVRQTTTLPLLRKEFIIHPYQLAEARYAGADAVLLIAAALSPDGCHALAEEAHRLGLEVLLEIHTEREMGHIPPCVDMVGVNNRDLDTFRTDVQTSLRLASLLPKHALHVSESGIDSPSTVRQLQQAGYRGFLIGGHFMCNPSPGQALETFLQQYAAL